MTIPAGGFKLIFASGKDRSNPAAELHTRFKLDADGEFLALIRPDGQTVEFAYDEFPRQVEDISYGLIFAPGTVQEVTVASEFAAARIRVPADGSDGLAWTAQAYDDSGWLADSAAIGYEREPESENSYVGYFQTDLESLMYGETATAYVRIPFTIGDPSAFTALSLRMRYDDGFVAYINGVEVAGANAPASPAPTPRRRRRTIRRPRPHVRTRSHWR